MKRHISALIIFCLAWSIHAQPQITNIAEDAWAGSSINVVDGRRSGLFTRNGMQFAAYYNQQGHVVTAMRRPPAVDWKLLEHQQNGNIADAHNFISMAFDVNGTLHMSWDHHNNPLNYARSIARDSMDLTELPDSMVGPNEASVSYPQFYPLASGNLVFLYRDGASGRGNLVMNYYDAQVKQWSRRHDNLISGEDRRNAYWSLAVDGHDHLHLAWTWRETWDVSTNHDLMYAKSTDGGVTWQRSTGEAYDLPITQATAEVIARIPQRSKLMNPPFVAADAAGNAYVTSYWAAAPGAPPQFHLAARGADGEWAVTQITDRSENFDLAGGGTKRQPISRAVLLAGGDGQLYLVYRDDARGGGVVLASGRAGEAPWRDKVVWESDLGGWEPVHDPVQWRDHGELHLLLQVAHQRDGNDSNPVASEPAELRTLILKPVDLVME